VPKTVQHAGYIGVQPTAWEELSKSLGPALASTVDQYIAAEQDKDKKLKEWLAMSAADKKVIFDQLGEAEVRKRYGMKGSILRPNEKPIPMGEGPAVAEEASATAKASLRTLPERERAQVAQARQTTMVGEEFVAPKAVTGRAATLESTTAEAGAKTAKAKFEEAQAKTGLSEWEKDPYSTKSMTAAGVPIQMQDAIRLTQSAGQGGVDEAAQISAKVGPGWKKYQLPVIQEMLMKEFGGDLLKTKLGLEAYMTGDLSKLSAVPKLQTVVERQIAQDKLRLDISQQQFNRQSRQNDIAMAEWMLKQWGPDATPYIKDLKDYFADGKPLTEGAKEFLQLTDAEVEQNKLLAQMTSKTRLMKAELDGAILANRVKMDASGATALLEMASKRGNDEEGRKKDLEQFGKIMAEVYPEAFSTPQKQAALFDWVGGTLGFTGGAAIVYGAGKVLPVPFWAKAVLTGAGTVLGGVASASYKGAPEPAKPAGPAEPTKPGLGDKVLKGALAVVKDVVQGVTMSIPQVVVKGKHYNLNHADVPWVEKEIEGELKRLVAAKADPKADAATLNLQIDNLRRQYEVVKKYKGEK
jgi:hypothetical protein